MARDPRPIVLLISGDPRFIYLIERYGRSSGCRVVGANTEEEALTQIHHERPTLILLDVYLPPLDCWHIFAALKADRATHDIPAAVCSAITEEARAWEEGADYWLAQPVLYEDFLTVLAATGTLPPHTSLLEPGGGAP